MIKAILSICLFVLTSLSCTRVSDNVEIIDEEPSVYYRKVVLNIVQEYPNEKV